MSPCLTCRRPASSQPASRTSSCTTTSKSGAISCTRSCFRSFYRPAGERLAGTQPGSVLRRSWVSHIWPGFRMRPYLASRAPRRVYRLAPSAPRLEARALAVKGPLPSARAGWTPGVQYMFIDHTYDSMHHWGQKRQRIFLLCVCMCSRWQCCNWAWHLDSDLWTAEHRKHSKVCIFDGERECISEDVTLK